MTQPLTPEQSQRRSLMPFTVESIDYTRKTFPGSTPEVVWVREGGKKFREEGTTRDVHDGHQPGRDGADPARPVAAAGPVNGFWFDAEWLYCRDKKWRPVKPGTFPLVDGAAFRVDSGSPFAGKHRAQMLRGGGNAINAEQAAAFIESCGVNA